MLLFLVYPISLLSTKQSLEVSKNKKSHIVVFDIMKVKRKNKKWVEVVFGEWLTLLDFFRNLFSCTGCTRRKKHLKHQNSIAGLVQLFTVRSQRPINFAPNSKSILLVTVHWTLHNCSRNRHNHIKKYMHFTYTPNYTNA